MDMQHGAGVEKGFSLTNEGTSSLSNTICISDPQGGISMVSADAIQKLSAYGEIARVDTSLVSMLKCVLVTFFDVRSTQKALLELAGQCEQFPPAEHDFRIVLVSMAAFASKVGVVGAFNRFGEVADISMLNGDAIVEFYDMRSAQRLCALAGGSASPCMHRTPAWNPSMTSPALMAGIGGYGGLPGGVGSVARGRPAPKTPAAAGLSPNLAAGLPPQLTREALAAEAVLQQTSQAHAALQQLAAGGPVSAELSSSIAAAEAMLRHLPSVGGGVGAALGLTQQLAREALVAEANLFKDEGSIAPAKLHEKAIPEQRPAPTAKAQNERSHKAPAQGPGVAFAQDVQRNGGNSHNATNGTEAVQTAGKGPVHTKISNKDFSKYDINSEKIAAGEDLRTTVMVRNLVGPRARKDFLKFLEKHGLDDRYTFFYMPCKEHRDVRAGFAFVNFKSAEDVRQLYMLVKSDMWHEARRNEPGTKPLAMSYARFQGHEELMSHFSSSVVLHEQDPEKRPIFFNPDSVPSHKGGAGGGKNGKNDYKESATLAAAKAAVPKTHQNAGQRNVAPASGVDSELQSALARGVREISAILSREGASSPQALPKDLAAPAYINISQDVSNSGENSIHPASIGG